jgi:hypothetical protein
MPAELIPTIEAPLQELTPQQQKFCELYAADLKANAAKAARGAGCGKAAKVTACRWMKLPQITAEIERIKEELLHQAGVNRHAILMETAKLAHGPQKRVGGSVKLRALEILGRWAGMDPTSDNAAPQFIAQQINVNIRRVGA